MIQQRPKSLTILAWFLIVVHSLRATTNAYAIATSLAPYPTWLWASLGVSKILVVIAAYFLLKMKKVAIWIFIVATVFGWSISIGFANQYTPVGWWRYAVGLTLIGVYVAIVAPHWSKLTPNGGKAGAPANA